MGKKYQVLARKYRPQRFLDVVGQEAVLTTLKNALQFDQIAHAYLFCGSRGVGKTTLARLFAKALNCLQRGADLEPCNACASCQEISSGQSLDVIEIDGASNRGIDDIRQINETVGYAPSHGQYKIYIIDEVHMLTKEAFNALLKTLEEPPQRAKFFFATTEPHKVLPTIISRCQRFDLSRIDPELITNKLADIAGDLERDVEMEALHLIASFADGSLRDAESLFDQILCFSSSAIQASTVREALGLVAEEYFSALDLAFADCHLAYAFELVEKLFRTGKDLPHFLEQLVDHYRCICLSKTVGLEALSPHLTKRYEKSASFYTSAQALYILDLLITAEQTMQKSPFPRVTLESTLLHLIRSKNRIPIEVIARRLHALEEAMKTSDHSLKVPAQEIEKIDAEMPHSILEPKEPAAAPPSVFVPEPTPVQEPSALEKPPSTASVFIPAPTETPLETETSPALEHEEAPSVFIKTPPESQPAVSEQKEYTFEAPSVFTPQNNQTTPLQKHASHYETMMRFAAVELEGTLKM